MKLQATAPIRISLFGGGTDLDSYAEKYGGVCINMAINIQQEFELDTEGDGWIIPEMANVDFYNSFFREFGIDKIGLIQKFDGFIHGGLGSSASAAVALVAGLSRIKGQELSKQEIAERAWDIEVNKLGLFGGRQDQNCAVFGGFNLMKFGKEVKVQSFNRGVAEKIAKNILLFDTGIRRKKDNIQEGLKKLNSNQIYALDMMKELASRAYHKIYRGDIKGVGDLLDKTWQFKKKSNKVTTPEIDKIYDKAKQLGAWGGKLLGSGGGGAMIFIVPTEKQKEFKEKIGLRWIDYSIDWNGVQTRFI
jgi:D-glycero-alpha-D-manno-heptose-7-phosphate kinase